MQTADLRQKVYFRIRRKGLVLISAATNPANDILKRIGAITNYGYIDIGNRR
jgi:hypothetical protein